MCQCCMTLCVLKQPPLGFGLSDEEVKSRCDFRVSQPGRDVADVCENRSRRARARAIAQNTQDRKLGPEQRVEVTALLREERRPLQMSDRPFGIAFVEEDPTDQRFAPTLVG